ncbi:ANTAR domain-containing protein [Streptomyces beigongshangae]|uniref:ANTAR domain-containing protein n=1 Tax=Streptomyces beigongshangae TaxID=2841597 RepID=UPI001C852EB6|nr:ANTAR domain-containing protein [Streptomyces sp. REN17]
MMAENTLTKLVRELQPGGSGPSHQWCGSLAALLVVDGTAVTFRMDGSELLWSSDETGTCLDDVQYTLGQGPALDAARDGGLYLVPDLERASTTRWPLFTAEALALGVRAVFALPLRLGAARIGALVCHRCEAGSLSQRSLDDALAVSDALAVFLLAGARRNGEAFGPAIETMDLHRAEVHQATGMLSAQLHVSLPTALARLRGHAYASGRPITDVARDVLDRRLRLPDS